MIRRTFYAKIFISLILLAFFALKIDPAVIKSVAHGISPSSWVWALLVMYLQIIALAIRWQMLVNVDNPGRPIAFMTSLRMTAVSFLANYLFISTVGGIVARTVLTMSHGISFVKSLTAALVDRCMTLLSLLLLGAFFMPFLWDFLAPTIVSHYSLLGFTLLAGLLACFMLIIYKKRHAIIFSNRKIAMCYKYLRTLLNDLPRLGKIVMVSVFGQIMYFIAVYVIMKSLGADFSLFKFMAVIPAITLIATLPIGYGGWGIREGTFMYGLSLIGITPEIAFIASVQIGLLTMLTALTTGIPSFVNNETQLVLKNLKNGKKKNAVFS